MRAPAQQSLSRRLLLLVFGSTLLAALVISGVAIDSTRRSQQEMVARVHPAALARATAELRAWIQEGQRAAAAAAARVEPRPAPEQLTRLVRESAMLRSLVWVGADASRPRTSHPLPPGLARQRLRALARGRAPGLIGVELGGDATTLAVWLPHGSGGLLALLEPDRVTSKLQAQRPLADSVFGLLDAAGRPLLAVSASATPTVADLSALRGAAGEIREYSVAGIALVGTAQPLDVQGGNGWQLALQTPFASAHAPMLALVKRVLGVAALVILVVCFIAYRLSARALRPIELLSIAARRVARGETEVELPPVRSRDEVGVLTQTLGEMLEQIRAHQSQLEAANRDLVERNSELESANEVLGQLSITDGLTQLHNHRFFQDQLTREIKRITRTGESLSVVILDIDDFKKLNDCFGHAAGDEILSRIARLLESNVRDSDLVVRYGGEEFVILASNTGLEGAMVLAEKVRTVIAENSFVVDDSLRPMRVTVSAGVAQYSGNRKRFFTDADEALYRAKAAGKNCVVTAD